MPLSVVPDHVAVAVHDLERAGGRWHDRLGGGWVGPSSRFDDGHFWTRQLRYGNGVRLELLEPMGDEGFLADFLRRFGPRVHHVTLTVPDLLDAVPVVEAAGYDVVDVSVERDDWHEGFLRPSQVGGLIVQVARSPWSLEDRIRREGGVVEDPAAGAPALHGPALTHPDLDEAAGLWTLLGAEVTREAGVLVARWPGHGLDVRVEHGETAAAVGLRFSTEERAWTEDPAV